MILAAIFLLISTALCTSGGGVSASGVGSLAFAVPEYSVDGTISFSSVVFAIALLLIISFINIPRKSLELFQSQTTVLSGVYLGLSHILYSLSTTTEHLRLLVGFGSIVAAVMSYNEEFRSIFMASICSYITTYYGVLISRMGSKLKAAIVGGILFFAYLVFGRLNGKLLASVSKAGVTSLGIVALIDTWGIISLFEGMHGAEGTTGLVYGFLIGGSIIFISFITVFVINYYPEWTQEKVNKLKSSG